MKTPFPALYSRLCLFTAVASATLPAHSLAQSAWSGATDNEFSNTSNWTPSAPGTTDTASVDTGSPQVTSDVTVGHLDVGGGDVTVTNTGILTSTNGTTINSGSVSINAGGVVNSDVDLNGGSLSIDGDLNGKLMLNNGNVNVNGTLDSAVVGTATALSNNGTVDEVDISSGGTFVNNSGATAGTVTNAGTTSNAGTIGSLTNTAGNFTNNSGGTVTGKTTVSGGTVTNNFVISDADVAAVAAFVNNNGATAGTIRNSGTVTNAGTVASVQNDAGTFSNNVGGTVTGSTNIAGGGVANSGTLNDVNIGAGGTFTNASGATAGHVTNAGNASNAGSIDTLANTAGTFTNNSGGTIAGKTTIEDGTVVNNFVITDADVAATASFVNNSGATAGAIRNSGTVTNAGTVASLQNDAGTFTNNAGGVIAGKTTIAGGTVTNNFVITDADVAAVAAFVNNSGATAGAIRNSGTVTNAGTVASVQNDAGSFTNNAGGTVTGSTTISGGQVVNNATLANVDIGAAGNFTNNSGAVAGTVTNAGNASNDGTIAALQNNDGTFSNSGIISGAATVAGGSLVNNGTISGSVDIDDGGALAGTGTVGGLLVNAGGILAPGPWIGTIAVNGDLTFRAGSAYEANIDASGASDTVDATGVVSIQGGTLDIKAASGIYGLTTSYTILTGSSITGTFDDVSSDFAFLSPELTYGTTAVDMQLERNGVRFSDVADTANSRATAAAVEALGSGSSVYDTVLSLDSQTADSAFTQLSGEVHASLKSALLWQSRFTRDAILDEMAANLAGRKDEATFWTSSFASSNLWSGDGNAAGIDMQTAGIVLGADAPISDQWRIGGMLSYSHDAFEQANVSSYGAGLYAAGDIGPLNFVGGAVYAHNEESTRRSISFGTFADELTVDYASATSQVFADVSWTQELNRIRLQPFVNLAYVNLDSDAFSESGGDAALSAASGSDAIATSTAGLRWSMGWPDNDLPATIAGMLAWRHIAGDVTPYSSMAFAGGGPFIIEGVEMPQDSLLVRMGISAELSNSAQVTLGYSGEFGKGLQSSAVQMSLAGRF